MIPRPQPDETEALRDLDQTLGELIDLGLITAWEDARGEMRFELTNAGKEARRWR